MALRHVILGLLVDEPAHAYALKHRLSPGVPRDELVNDGVLYPLLARLESDGLAASSEQPGRAGRPRRVYAATAAGASEFHRWLRSSEDEQGPPRYELFATSPLVKLLFAGHLSDAELTAKLAFHAREVSARIDVLTELQEVLSQASGLGPALLELEAGQLQARLSWLEGQLDV